MARKKKKGGAKPKAKPAKKRESRQQPVVVADEGEQDDPIALGVIIMTAVFLLAAVLVNMVHLGNYGVGPFK